MKKIVLLLAALFATNVSADDRMTYKLDTTKTDGSRGQFNVSTIVGQTAIYSESRTDDSDTMIEGVSVRVLPLSLAANGAVLTEVVYNTLDGERRIERTKLVELIPGEKQFLFVTSADGVAVDVTLLH